MVVVQEINAEGLLNICSKEDRFVWDTDSLFSEKRAANQTTLENSALESHQFA